jgi:predicted ATPase
MPNPSGATVCGALHGADRGHANKHYRWRNRRQASRPKEYWIPAAHDRAFLAWPEAQASLHRTLGHCHHLFVEEMTKAVLEAGGELEAVQTVAAVPSPVLAVPASLHASLMARLDRLGPAKEVAQIGAAIGREFSHALLAVVVSKPEAQLSASLDRLIRAGLLFRNGVPPHASYLFKHALVQDAAYGTLLRQPRRALHARIATPSKASLPRSPRPSRRCLHGIAPRLD